MRLFYQRAHCRREGVERRFCFCLCRLDHQALWHNMGPIHRGCMYTGIQKPFREIKSPNTCLLLQRLGGTDELVAAEILERNVENVLQLGPQIVSVEHCELAVAA